MKYNDNNLPMTCMMTQSTCYKGTTRMKPVGVLWHSTGANNPYLWRYVQPDDNAADRDKLISLIGKNNNRNDWNHMYVQAGLNAWIGKLADGTVTTVQTMPWDYKPWGCGSGANGSCNNGWIQFEIAEDSLTNADYFNKVYTEACEITAYLCKMYGIDPNGYTMLNGVKVPNILCHADSHKLGLGSNHGDINHWFPRFGKSMETVRKDVAALLGSSQPVTNPEEQKPAQPVQPEPEAKDIKVGDVIQIKAGAKYATGQNIPSWVLSKTLYAREIRANGDVVFSTLKTGAVTGVIKRSDIIGQDSVTVTTPATQTPPQPVIQPSTGVPYLVKVVVDLLNIRGGAGSSYALKGTITNHGVYTIVDVNGDWGKLKSGAGWIYLPYTKRV